MSILEERISGYAKLKGPAIMHEQAISGATSPRVSSFSRNWYRALRLKERQASLDTLPEILELPLSEQQTWRARKWRQQAPFEDAAYFQERLDLAGISKADFLFLLNEPESSLEQRIAPAEWMETLQRIFGTHTPDSNPHFLSAEGSMQYITHCLRPFYPLVLDGVQRFSNGLACLSERYTSVPFDLSTVDDLCLPHLLERLFSVLGKTLTLELHIARLQGRLVGETGEERFQSYIAQLCEPGACLAFLEEYPVLAQQLVTITQYWVTYALEVLDHLCADWQELCQTFSPQTEPGSVAELRFGSGDTHRQGRSVLGITFQSGLKLIYKPRSLAIDSHFQQLLTWLNKHDNALAFRTLKVLEKQGYGWSEFVQARGCEDEGQLARFYERQGGYLALLHALQATDVHYENLIASGEHPVLIDLEAIFQPELFFSAEELEKLSPGMGLMNTSVLRTHLLPMRSWGQVAGEGVDISGVSGRGGQLTPRPVARFDGMGTDEVRLVRRRVTMPETLNRPRLRGQEVEVLKHIEDIARGFARVYRLLVDHRAAFLREILPRFERDEIRIIPRATQTYMRLLQEGWHPSLLRNGLDHERFLDRLWLSVPQQADFKRLIAAEQEDLCAGDIPLFTSVACLPHLYDSRGRCLSEILRESGYDLGRRHIMQMDEVDLDRQLWLLRASFTTLTQGSGKSWWKPSHLKPPERSTTLQQRLLSAARAIGDRLLAQMLTRGAERSWLGLHLLQEQHWHIAPIGIDLYSGSGGICFFLAYLGAVTGNEEYTAQARALFASIQGQFEAYQEQPLGAFRGKGAFFYLAAHLGSLWQDQSIIEHAEVCALPLAEDIDRDEYMDIISGTAGCLLSLLALYRVNSSEQVLALARACGEHLLRQAHPQVQGIAWPSPQFAGAALTGFSHGNAGIALSLLRLAQVSGEKRFCAVAREAMAYERGVFDPSRRNWPDLRPLGAGHGEAEEMISWCHGAAGIGLARLASLPLIDDPVLREEIDIALNTTLERGFGQNHSLCHGDLGNLEVLLSAHLLLPEKRLGDRLVDQTAMLLESIEKQGWCTGVPLGIEIPGLMTGLAGIGYGLLRVAVPASVPALLHLEAPYGKPSAKGEGDE